MKNPQEESDKLRREAKDLLNRQLLSMMGIHNDGSNSIVGLNCVDRIVDCIIGAAVLETSAIMAAAISQMKQGEQC